MKESYDLVLKDAFIEEIPISATIELTTLCNWRCKHCYLPSHAEKGLNKDKLKELLLDLRKLGVHQVAYTGGEVFKRKDFIDIVRFSRDLYFRVNILSNASMITSEIAKALSDIYITDLSLTIFSLDENIHDRITQVEGSLKDTLQGVKILSEKGIDIEIKTPILTDNYNDFLDVKNYCVKNGYAFTSSPSIFTKTNGEDSPLEYFLSQEILNKIIKDVDEATNFKGRDSESIYMCPSLKHSLFISSDGTVYPCNGFYNKVGNIYDESIGKIWNSEYYRSLRNLKNEENKECSQCNLFDVCERCPGTVLSETGNINGCSAMCKSIALARYNNK